MDNENNCLKTGFLLRLEVSKNWKLRWFGLHEDEIICYHKRDRTVVIDTLSLHGCSVVCPCIEQSEYNSQGTFKILTPSGEELYFQAAGKADRDGWAHAIGAVIRSLSVSKQVCHTNVQFQTLRTNTNISEIFGAIQDPDAGVELGNHVRNGAVHKNCFKGSEVVDWLVRWSIVRKRNDGMAMAQMLLKLGHLQEVDINDGAAGAATNFIDGDKLYRYTSLHLGSKRNSFYDSTDSDSSTSEDEDDDTHHKLKKGKIIKESFLLKKKQIRKDWRIVKATLRENPATLEYCRALAVTSEIAVPSRLIDLNELNPLESKKDTGPSSADSTEKTKKRSKIYLKDKKGKQHAFRTKDDIEQHEWMTLLQQLCSKKPARNK